MGGTEEENAPQSTADERRTLEDEDDAAVRSGGDVVNDDDADEDQEDGGNENDGDDADGDNAADEDGDEAEAVAQRHELDLYDPELSLPVTTVYNHLRSELDDRMQLQRDVRSGAMVACKVFILYLSASAREISQHKRYSVQDLAQALEDMEFSDLIPFLEDGAAEYSRKQKRSRVDGASDAAADEGRPLRRSAR